MNKPKVIFFDAVGTLFGVKGSVGEVYRQIALEFDVELAAASLERAFRASFKNASPLTFPGIAAENIPQQEFAWWRSLVLATITKVGGLEKFADFDAFFSRLYHHFAQAQPWYIYPDVIPTLKYWQAQKISLGIISNFDTRLFQVLELLELKQFFDSVTISSLSGSAKPDRQIFVNALAKHSSLARQAWHIGDSEREDYQGAKAVGINSWWLARHQNAIIGENQLPNLSSLR